MLSTSEHADNPVVLRNRTDVLTLFDRVRSQYRPGVRLLVRVRIAEDPAGQELFVGVNGPTSVMRYVGPSAPHGVNTKFTGVKTNAEPVTYYNVTGAVQFPPNSEEPLYGVQVVLTEFLVCTDGQLPAFMDWHTAQ